MNMDIIKALSHEAKVILSAIGTAVGTLLSNPELLTVLIANPLSTSLPIILPKLVAMGAIGGALYNMTPKKVE